MTKQTCTVTMMIFFSQAHLRLGVYQPSGFRSIPEAFSRSSGRISTGPANKIVSGRSVPACGRRSRSRTRPAQTRRLHHNEDMPMTEMQ